MANLLDSIDGPEALKRLAPSQLAALAQDVRELLIETCARTGGHLAPNLGVVELTIALHRVLRLPHDRIVWDVSHQTYTHKILTGRRAAFAGLRQEGGLSGYSNPSESPYDAFGAGHASTSVSAALGMVIAREQRGSQERIVAVLGDGALTGGLVYEALNNAGNLQANFVVILNDNEMSIAPNVGSIASYLSRLRSKPFFSRARERAKDVLAVMPFGNTARKALLSAEVAAMRFVAPDEKAAVIFEEMGFRYIGPVNGHDIDTLVDVLGDALQLPGPVLVHVRTTKGKGFAPAEQDARRFHGCGSFAVTEDGENLVAPIARRTFSDAFGDALTRLAEHDRRIIAITAAMPDGTKVATFAKRFPARAFDVGIAEAHAACSAAGIAAAGLRPVCALYSTFLQRAYDQIVHDVVLQRLPVVFAIDRAGLVGDDGPTHMGLYDIPMLRALPHITFMAPRNETELEHMLAHALRLAGPSALRYPRGSSTGACEIPVAPLIQGKAEVLRRGQGVAVLALGNTCDAAWAALQHVQGGSVTLVNARFIVPLDTEMLIELSRDHRHLITVEEGTLAGGFGSAVLEAIADLGLPLRTERLGVGPQLIAQATQARQREWCGLDPVSIAARINAAFAALAKESLKQCQVLPFLP